MKKKMVDDFDNPEVEVQFCVSQKQRDALYERLLLLHKSAGAYKGDKATLLWIPHGPRFLRVMDYCDGFLEGWKR